ncbi:MAG: NAD(P)-binding domain-containing protein, partial [Pseudomonadota bacterium]
MARTVGLLGLGIMGSAMTANLLRAGWRVLGYDPVPSCRRRLARAGGAAASSINQVADLAPILISSLPSEKALEAVSEEIPGGKARIVIETSTLPIAAKEAARRRLAAAGVTLLDCPLSGTGAQARAGDLAVYGSGPRIAYRKVVRVLKAFSRSQYFLGAFGNGSKMKFAAN